MDDADAEVYRKHAASLVRLAASLVGPSDAEDVLSSAVIRVMASRSWPTVENKGGYLYRSVVNEARRFLSSRSSRERRELLWESPDRVYQPQISPEIQEAVASLSARQRAVVFLTYWEDLDGATTADRLGISEGSVRRHLDRARKALKGKIHV